MAAENGPADEVQEFAAAVSSNFDAAAAAAESVLLVGFVALTLEAYQTVNYLVDQTAYHLACLLAWCLAYHCA